VPARYRCITLQLVGDFCLCKPLDCALTICLSSLHFLFFNLIHLGSCVCFLYDDSMFFASLFSVSDQPQYQFAPFSDPAIMSARFASPVLSSANLSYAGTPAIATAAPAVTTTYGPPPGLTYPNSESLSFVQGRESQVRVPSPVLAVRKFYHRP
jgi:hypothetical protein